MEAAMRNVSINDRTSSMSPIIKAEPPSLTSEDVLVQDQPIDFSTKVRQRVLESSDESSIRKVSNDSAIDCSNDAIEDSRPIEPATVRENESEIYPSQPRLPAISLPMPNISTFLPQPSSSVAGMGMLYQPPVFPNYFPPGFAGPMWPNPMAAMMHQQEVARKMLSASVKVPPTQAPVLSSIKPTYGSKQSFAKPEMPVMGPGVRPFPPMPNFASAGNLNNIPDPSVLAEALKNHEEMFSAYKQQVLSQKAAEESKKGARRQPAATVTNGTHSTISAHTNGNSSSATESFSLSQIDEDHTLNSPSSNSIPTGSGEVKLPLAPVNGTNTHRETQSSLYDDKHSGSVGSLGENTSNGGSSNATSNTPGTSSSAGPSLHSSDESLQTNDSRRSLTPAHSSNSELHDMTGMRPRSMTLPTQSDHRLMSHSPSPSVLSTSNNSSGPGTPNSKNDRGFRKRARTLPDDQKVKKTSDEAYWERRRKNNEAAKRSRDSRRAKEDEIAIRAAFLEQENIRLRLELAALKAQTAKLRSELVIFQGPEDTPTASRSRPADGS
ncbi:uncharacterized protein [Watersipora subatra]|uniref:uncharacterized protein isoform X2 n=1 Tax=Watersipora subatra TaxID=2589382 RepID=UPI00355AE39E